MSTTIEVWESTSTICHGHGLGFEPMYEALDEAATKVLIIHARRSSRAMAQYVGNQRVDGRSSRCRAGKLIESRRIPVGRRVWTPPNSGAKMHDHRHGQGATTDMAGFVCRHMVAKTSRSSTFRPRFLPWWMPRSAETGINRQNLVGSFYPTASVIADMDLLDSLPGPDLAAGARSW